MVSDGIATIDRRDRFKPDCELVALTGARDADIGYLSRLVSRSPADVLRVNGRELDGLLARLQSATSGLIDIRDSRGTPLAFASLPGPRGRISAVGRAPADGQIVVRLSDGAKIIERRYAIDGKSVTFDGAGALWAADQVVRLAGGDRRKQLIDVSRRYDIASPHLSFVVLESPEDYAVADLAPPRRYPEEWRAEYAEARAEWEQERKAEQDRRLQEVAKRWERQKEWWATPFDPAAPATPPAGTRRRAEDGAPVAAPPGGQDELQEVVTTGSRAVASGTRIELEPWNVNRPYIKALRSAPADRFAAVLLAQEAQYGDLPAFHLDVAEWLYRQKRVPEAIEAALSALELPSRNDETLAIVAERMSPYGDLDRAVSLFERLIELAPERPQPRRSLRSPLRRAPRSRRPPLRQRTCAERYAS